MYIYKYACVSKIQGETNAFSSKHRVIKARHIDLCVVEGAEDEDLHAVAAWC